VGPSYNGGRQRLNQIKYSNSNEFKRFQIASKLDRLKNALPELKKSEIKYNFEGFEEMNNFVHRNFLRFRTDFR
jgi:uncharacterized protein YdhG (YjbR/CyaY superfamily)